MSINPLLEPASLKLSYPPLAEENPFRGSAPIFPKDWIEVYRQVSGTYPYSLRLSAGQRWYEFARFHDMKAALTTARAFLSTKLPGNACMLAILKCTRVGKEGREQPLYYYPDEAIVLAPYGIAVPEKPKPEDEVLALALTHLTQGAYRPFSSLGMSREQALAWFSHDGSYTVHTFPQAVIKDTEYTRQWKVTIGKSWVIVGCHPFDRIEERNLFPLDAKIHRLK